MADPIEVTEEGKINRDKLAELAKKAGNNVTDARTAVIEITQEYANMTLDERKELIKAARADILKTKPGVGAFDPNVFVFQVVVRAEENKDGNPIDDFRYFSEFNEQNSKDGFHFHPDGLYGPRTKSVAFGDDKDKLNNVASQLDKIVATGGNIPVPTREGLGEKKKVETEAERLAREAAEKEKAAKEALAKKLRDANRASPEDLDAYTFNRAEVQYYETVAKKNPNAKAFNAEQLKAVNDAVREYAFDADGNVKKTAEDGRKFDINNATVQDQIRSKILEKTKELGVTEDQISQLSFSLDKNQRTRSIVGGFNAAGNAMVRADEALSNQADKIKAHVESADNAEYLKKAGISLERVVDLKTEVQEDQRGVYFKTNFVPPLTLLAEKERKEITEEYATKVENEKAKLLKYSVLDRVVNASYPQMIEVQKIGDDGKPVFKEKKKVAYATKDYTDPDTKIAYKKGDEVVNVTQVPVMDEVKRPDEKDLKPIEPNLNDRATREALLAAGLIGEDNAFKALKYTAKVNGKDEERTVQADVALKDPKQYSAALKGALDQTYAFTDEELKKNEYGGANLDRNIVKKKIEKLAVAEKEAVAKEVIRLETERDVKIEGSPSNVMLRETFIADDRQRIADGKPAKSILGKYEEANKLYKLEAEYETTRQIDELTGDGMDRGERKGQKKAAKDIQEFIKKRLDGATAEVKELEKAEKDEKDETKKTGITARLATARANLESLTPLKDEKIDHAKKFDTKDRVDIVNVNIDGKDLIHVDAISREEKKKLQADLKKQAKQAEDAVDSEKDAAKKAADDAKKAADEAKKAKPEVVKEAATTTDAAPKEEKKATGAVGIELTGDINALLERIRADGVAAQEIAAVKPVAIEADPFTKTKGKSEADVKKELDKQIDAKLDGIADSLKALRKYAKQDKAEGTEFDQAVAQTLADAGVVANKDLKLDEKQTIQSIKDKAAQQRQ